MEVWMDVSVDVLMGILMDDDGRELELVLLSHKILTVGEEA